MSERFTVFVGDCREVLRGIDESSVDAVVTDPPYGLGFMNREWDKFVAFQRWCEEWARELIRVVKPGGHVVAFGGNRTYHRLAVALEDAGFEIRDCLMWLHGEGFPKSLDVSKAIDKAAGAERPVVGERTDGVGNTDRSIHKHEGFASARERVYIETAPATDDAKRWEGWGTALRPSWEPIVLARRPLSGTVEENVRRWGTGGLNVDACRLPTSDHLRFPRDPGTLGSNMIDRGKVIRVKGAKQGQQSDAGRWPSNWMLCHSSECVQVGTSKVRSGKAVGGLRSKKDGAVFGKGWKQADSGDHTYADPSGYEAVEEWACVPDCPIRRLDDQSGEVVSRFFYCPKAGRRDRDEGLDDLPVVMSHEIANRKEGSPGMVRSQAPGTGRNVHPTVKPTSLMRWLCRLVTPPGGVILDPFMGSGSTGKAAMLEGFRFVGVEIDPEMVEVARRRVSHASLQSARE